MEEETPRSDPFYESFHPQRSERHQGERVEADQGAVPKKSCKTQLVKERMSAISSV